ncbi:hypothetical protein [Alicyclobacillus sp. SO9]|uniref:hypothetical protein n=1 Tax=Alicyclobacillus sp. SO9 TaxID=2665646 RepID=UPI0018E7BF52|nr:hypothetical protein [Alicyclobacillus sp. SO9]QQE78363.1 hypothetical protein GI364_21210 [Alicyclobacillus sp. SO9]
MAKRDRKLRQTRLYTVNMGTDSFVPVGMDSYVEVNASGRRNRSSRRWGKPITWRRVPV